MPRGRTIRTPKKAAKFLAALRRTGNISRACKAEGIGRTAAYAWREVDLKFAERWDEALEEGIDNLEQEAYRRAYAGTLKPVFHQGKKCGSVKEYSDTLTIFLMKAARPEKYRERLDHKHEFSSLTDSEIIIRATSTFRRNPASGTGNSG